MTKKIGRLTVETKCTCKRPNWVTQYSTDELVAKDVAKDFAASKETMESLRKPELQSLLKKHDEWFSSWEDFKEERGRVNSQSKPSIVKWILDTDPIFMDGGLLDFLVTNKVISNDFWK